MLLLTTYRYERGIVLIREGGDNTLLEGWGKGVGREHSQGFIWKKMFEGKQDVHAHEHTY